MTELENLRDHIEEIKYKRANYPYLSDKQSIDKLLEVLSWFFEDLCKPSSSDIIAQQEIVAGTRCPCCERFDSAPIEREPKPTMAPPSRNA